MGKFKFSDETLEHIFSKERTREVKWEKSST